METYDEMYNAFIAALRHFADKEGYGGQSVFAAKAGISNGFLSQVIRGSYSKKAGIKTQVALAKACGYDHAEFIDLGRKLLYPENKTEAATIASATKPIEFHEDNEDAFKNDLREKVISLLASQRGLQSKLSKSIGKPSSFFSELKRGNPVNALHLKAIGIVFGAECVNKLLGIDNIDIAYKDKPDVIIELEHMSLIKKFRDKTMGKRINEKLIELESINEDMLQKVEAFIEHAIFMAKTEPTSLSSISNPNGRLEGKLKNGTNGTE